MSKSPIRTFRLPLRRLIIPLAAASGAVGLVAGTVVVTGAIGREPTSARVEHAAQASKEVVAVASVPEPAYTASTWRRGFVKRHRPTTSSSTSTTTAPSATSTSPKPTTSGTSTAPASCGGTRVWAGLAACGWPGPGNTGYPSGQVFKSVTGGLVISADNTVIDGYKVSGGIQVRAKNVTIRNSWVTMDAGGRSGSGVINVNPGASATIERTTIDGLNATHTCIWHEGASMKAVANNCSRVNDGIFMWATTEGRDGAGDNFTIQDNWLHGFTTQAANGHIDGIQTEGAKHGVIRHNTIDVTQSQTSAISLWNSRKTTDDVTIDRNLLAGGGFSVYAEDYSPSESNPTGGYSVTNIRITNNVFSTVHYGCVGYWGVWFPRGKPTDGWNRSGNIVWETGAKVDSGNPTFSGRPCN